MVFESSQINGMQLKNRFVRSATWEGMANGDGACTPRLVETMVDLVKGGVGLIITGHAYVQDKGKASLMQMGVHDDELVAGLSNMTDAVHQNNGKIVLQLAHGGIFARKKDIPGEPIGPSPVSGLKNFDSTSKEMNLGEIESVQEAFVQGAVRAKKAGFDGVQVHAAHGYLLSQFLSPAFNKRLDEYGGNIENRAKMATEVIEKIRAAVGPQYPVLVKMNCEDFIEGGLRLKESVIAGKLFVRYGADALEISGGTVVSGKLNPARTGILRNDQEAYFKDYASAFRKEIAEPLILVGGVRSLETAEKIIEDNVADYISMSRPFICEPGLIKRWELGDRKKSACVSDGKCFIPGFRGKGVQCMTQKIDK